MTFIPDAFQTWVATILDGIQTWYRKMPPHRVDETLAVDDAAVLSRLKTFLERMENNYPFFHPRYAAQMLKPPHPVALAAYFAGLFYNTNNHALDGGPVPSELEKETIQELRTLLDWPSGLGHLTSSGTLANLEALWVGRELRPDGIIVASEHAHYTHERMAHVLRTPYESIPVDHNGRLDVNALEDRLRRQPAVGTVVLTLGTTGLGAVDPIHEVLDLRHRFEFQLHVDAAYGGFYRLLRRDPDVQLPAEALEAAAEADSFVVDPHKHGLQPYGCGSVLFRDPRVGRFYQHDSPYTYFTSDELHLGEISLECSRAGSAAAAFWFTLQLLPLRPDTGLGPILRRCRQAALKAHDALVRSRVFTPVLKPDLDIVAFFAWDGETPVPVSRISRRSRHAFRIFMEADPPIFVSLLKLDSNWLKRRFPALIIDEPVTTVLRMVLMKPEHAGEISSLIEEMESLFSSQPGP